MARYIDAELVLDELKEELEFDTPLYTQEQNQYVTRGIKIAIMDINRTPTADVVEVVRCEKCKHLTIHNSMDLYAFCEKTKYRFRPFQTDTRTHFCSYGERKE